MSEMISREAAAAICDEAACETDSESARYEMFRARDAIRALPAVQPDLTDPNVVHANMLRGTIAKPTVDQIRHIYGDDLPDAAAIREAALIKALENIRELNMTGEDEHGQRWAHSDLIEQEIVFALIDNNRKEVMPPVPVNDATNASDTGPGDQAVAGAAQKGDSHE
jgi:hypothetical protein